jgi:sugar phosphate permease
VALGLVYTGSNLGANAFVPIATWVALTQSWREALLTIGIGGALVILPFAAFVVRDRRASDGAAQVGEVSAEAPVAVEDGGPQLTAKQALRTRSFWVLYFALLVFFLYFLAVLDHFVATLEDSGISKETAATYFRTAILMGLFSKVGMGIFADALSGRLAFIVNHGLLTLSSLLLLVLPVVGAVPLFVVLFGFSYAARDVVYPLIITECFGVRHLAPIYGLLMTVLLPASTGGIFAGWSFDRFGSYDLAYAAFGALNLLVFVSLFLLRRERAGAAAYTAAP